MLRTVIYALILSVASVAHAETAEWKTYGAPVTGDKPLPLAEVLKNPDAHSGKTLTIAAKVAAACEKKGCWMELTPAGGEAASTARVTFKDYGFFVPLDSKGADAIVEGKVEVKTISKKEVDHLMGEGGTLKPLADGTAREVRIVASGVKLKK